MTHSMRSVIVDHATTIVFSTAGRLMGGLLDLVFLQGGGITKRSLQEHLLEQLRESLFSAAMREIAWHSGRPSTTAMPQREFLGILRLVGFGT